MIFRWTFHVQTCPLPSIMLGFIENIKRCSAYKILHLTKRWASVGSLAGWAMWRQLENQEDTLAPVSYSALVPGGGERLRRMEVVCGIRGSRSSCGQQLESDPPRGPSKDLVFRQQDGVKGRMQGMGPQNCLVWLKRWCSCFKSRRPGNSDMPPIRPYWKGEPLGRGLEEEERPVRKPRKNN